jgi:hypothetical protein
MAFTLHVFRAEDGRFLPFLRPRESVGRVRVGDTNLTLYSTDEAISTLRRHPDPTRRGDRPDFFRAEFVHGVRTRPDERGELRAESVFFDLKRERVRLRGWRDVREAFEPLEDHAEELLEGDVPVESGFDVDDPIANPALRLRKIVCRTERLPPFLPRSRSTRA